MARRPHAVAVAALTAVVSLAGCGAGSASEASDSQSSEALSVVASFYPLQYVVERVGGDKVSVTNLTKPGAEPHDLELAPQDVATLSDSDLAVYLSGFQPAVDDAISASSTTSLDVTDPANLSLSDAEGATDPHFWLDPLRLADVADAVAATLGDLAPDGAAAFKNNAADLREDLRQLNTDFDKGLAHCDSRLLVTSHEAFGYLADAYDLEQVGLTGLTPETEPTATDLATVTDFVNEHDVGTIFYESLVSPDVAQTVADATGAGTAMLDPVEGLTAESAGEDYLGVMRSNLETLRQGLGCS